MSTSDDSDRGSDSGDVKAQFRVLGDEWDERDRYPLDASPEPSTARMLAIEGKGYEYVKWDAWVAVERPLSGLVRWETCCTHENARSHPHDWYATESDSECIADPDVTWVAQHASRETFRSSGSSESVCVVLLRPCLRTLCRDWQETATFYAERECAAAVQLAEAWLRCALPAVLAEVVVGYLRESQ